MMPAIIPARGGSVRLPGKNLRTILGRSMLQCAVDAAAPVVGLENIYVSTDHAPTMDEARVLGVRVIERPAELASDTATAKSAAMHALEELGDDFDRFLYLQPTSPLRQASDVQTCVDLYNQRRCDTVVTVTESEVTPGRFWAKRDGSMEPYLPGADPFRRRQEQSTAFRPNGAVYVCTRKMFVESTTDSFLSGRVCAHVMPHHRSIDIDTHFDLMLAKVWARRISQESIKSHA